MEMSGYLKVVIVFFACEPFLLRRSNNLSIPDKCRGTVMIERGDAEDINGVVGGFDGFTAGGCFMRYGFSTGEFIRFSEVERFECAHESIIVYRG